MPSVVNIGTEQVVRVSDPFESYFSNFFESHYRIFREYTPLGSGIIVDAAGLVLTNYHVVQRASTIRVRLFDGAEYNGEMIAYDEANDLALLQLRGEVADRTLQSVAFALPGDLILGESVVTVGNPFGLEHSVAAGVLSATNRKLKEGRVTFNDIIQTDAAINPGNSGGPLINLDGELIGINLAIRQDAQGIGFAIPLRRIEDVLAHWLLPSRFSLASCGFVPQTHMKDGHAELSVSSVDPTGPAAAAGLKEGDVIEKVNGAEVRRAVDAGKLLWKLRGDDPLSLILRGGRKIEFQIVEMSPEKLILRRLGIRAQPLSKALKQALGLPHVVEGLAISEILPSSEFARRRLRWGDTVRRGDIIESVSGVPTRTLEDLTRVLKGERSGGMVVVGVITVDAIQDRVSLARVSVKVRLR